MTRLRPLELHAPLRFALVGLLLAIFVTTPAAAGERDLAMAEPAEVGMDPAGLERLSEAMHGMVDAGKLAGVVTAVSRKGKLVHFDAYGMQDLENQVPVGKDTIFRIYSMTKPVVGVALMTYYDEGRFALDDPVAKFIPQFADLKVAKEDGPEGNPVVEDADHPMTMRELMSHTAGLTYGLFSRSQVDTLYQKAAILDVDQTLSEMIDKLAQIPLRQQPGSLWHYSVAVDVQGYVLEVLGGKPLDEVLNERVFAPLGMVDTAFHVEKAKADRFSRIYTPNAEGKLTSPPNGQYLKKPNFLSGGGGLVSTAMDYMRFAQMLANGGELDGVRILKPETVKLMHTDHLPGHIGEIAPIYVGNRFGLDFAIVTDPNPATDHERAKGEYWWYGIGGTWFGINPVQDLVVVGMIQSRDFMASAAARVTSKRLAYEAITDPAN